MVIAHDLPVLGDDLARIRLYHSISQHSPKGYAPSPGFLDWDSQPDPFRHFLGSERLILPLDGPIFQAKAALGYHSLYGSAVPSAPLGLESLGLLCALAWGLSAWKAAEGARWSVRCVPSSGNLHPTEGYVLLWAETSQVPPGVYHYDVYGHALERRATLDPAHVQALQEAYPNHIGCLGLSSLIWREAWKYGARAFRYCQLDCGHAVASLAYAARVCGWGVSVEPRLTDAEVTALFGLANPASYQDREPEHPDCLLWLSSAPATPLPDDLGPLQALAGASMQWEGWASQVSAETVLWPEIALAQAATVKAERLSPAPVFSGGSGGKDPSSGPGAIALIRQRRSAQRMNPQQPMGWHDFQRLLRRLLPNDNGEGWSAWAAFPFAPAVQVLMMVHAVEGLEPGLYALNRVPERWAGWENGQGWQPVAADVPLFCLRAPEDLRRQASQLSCYQGIAGRGAVAFMMVADMGEILPSEGAWAYRRLHWEAGILGHILYLEAEASSLRGTGIGCFMDQDSLAMAGHAGGPDSRWQTVYHFTIGGAVEDPRVLTQPPYAHRDP